MSRPSRFVCLAGIVVVCLLAACAEARVFVVRADGTGDAPTFQAGLDSIAARYPESGDTLIVGPGAYEEDVELVSPVGSLVVLAPGGPKATSLRSLRFSRQTKTPSAQVQGLTIRDSTIVWFFLSAFSDCVFEGPVHFDNRRESFGFGSPFFKRCVFKSSFFCGHQGEIDSCAFEGPVTLHSYDATLFLRRCAFTNADTAVTVHPNAHNAEVAFRECTFSNVGVGITATSLVDHPYVKHFVGVDQCQFEGVARGAIDIVSNHSVWISVKDSWIARSGVGVRLKCGGLPRFAMARDTILESKGAGVDVDTEFMSGFTWVDGRAVIRGLDNLLIRDCGGDGVRIRAAGEEFVILNSTFEGSGGTGLRYEEVAGTYEYGGMLKVLGNVVRANGDGLWLIHSRPVSNDSIIGNTIVENEGAGLVIETAVYGAGQRVWAERNLIAGNGGVGLHVHGGFVGAVRFNDAWMNAGGDYAGVHDLSTNLVVDPQLCDPLAGDFHLASGSPCAASSPYGQIGALGVGCDLMTVPLDVQSHPINLGSNAPVEAAILGHRLFDPRTVDPATVRLAGAAPSGRGRGKPVAELRDVNQDGLTDLPLSFNARDLRIDGGDVILEGFTFDGVPFRGMDAVDARGPTPRAEPEAQVPTRLTLSAVQSRGVLTLLLDLPSPEPVGIEVFDVAGRHVLSRELPGLRPGRHRLQLNDRLAAGLYLLRLKQGTTAVVGRAVVLR